MFDPLRLRCSVLACLLWIAGCDAGGAPGTGERDEVEVLPGAPLDAPVDDPSLDPAPERDVFEPGIGFFPNAGLPAEAVDGLAGDAPRDLPEGVVGVAWRDLSLRELYGAELRALLFDGRPGEGGSAEGKGAKEETAPGFPDRVRALDGQRVGIVGFMIPLEWGEDRVPQFLLVRDLMSCCFGGAPMADEWVEVTMAAEAAEYVAYRPVLVVGRLEVAAFEDDWGFAVGCYRLRAESSEPFEGS